MESIVVILWGVGIGLILFGLIKNASARNKTAQPQMKGSKSLFGMSEKGDASISSYNSLQGLSADEMLDLGFLTYGTLTTAQLQQNMNNMQMQMDHQMQMDYQMQMDMQMNQQFMDQMQRDMQFQMDLNDPCNYGVLSGNEDIFQNNMNSLGSGFDSFGGGFDSFGGMGF